MTFSNMEALRELNPSSEEVAELARARQAGITDQACLELLRIARGRAQPFASGEAVAALWRVGVQEITILELAQLGQLGLGVGEMQAMRLAGLPDAVLLAQARRRSQGLTVLSGPSLAHLKNAGMTDAGILVLIERGVPDSETETMVRLLQRRYRPEEILRRYPGR